MTDDGIRTRRNFPPETWAVVRDAYLGGETAESIQKRLGISVNTIRKRANRCGWTHVAHARAIQRSGDEGDDALPMVDPQQARAGALSRAAALIAAGRAAEATALLKAAETLGRLTADAAPPAEPEPEPEPTPEEAAAFEARVRAQWEAYHADVRAEADKLARAMLEGGDPGHIHSLHAHRWRAETLGPEVGRADYERAKQFSTSPRSWTKEGELLPADAHDDRHWEQDRPRLMWVARGGSLED